MEWRDVVICDPKVLVGKPTIKGTRISVELILDHLSSGETREEILSSFPRLKDTDISAALAYAAELAGKSHRKLARSSA